MTQMTQMTQMKSNTRKARPLIHDPLEEPLADAALDD